MVRLLVITCVLLSPLAQAEVYRYTDENGVTVLSHQGVTPHAIRQGYEILNDQGRVIRVVPPPPTAAELQQRKHQQEREAADKRLLELYSSVRDLDIAREHRLRTLDAFVTVVAGNLELARQQISNHEQKIAQQERAGRKPDPELLRQLEQLKKDRQRLESELERRNRLRAQTDNEFASERARLVELYPATSSRQDGQSAQDQH